MTAPSAEEWAVLRLTLAVAGLAVGMALPAAVGTAAVLARGHFPGRTLLVAAVHLPLALPPVVTGWLLLLLLGSRGVLGPVLAGLGVRLVFTTAGAALACAVMIFPAMVRIVRVAFEGVDPRLHEAARVLGAGRLDRFLSLTLPLAAPGLLAAAAVGFTASLGEFGAVITFAANIPGVTRTLPLAIYTALQSPDGEAEAARLASMSVALAIVGLLASEVLARRLPASR